MGTAVNTCRNLDRATGYRIVLAVLLAGMHAEVPLVRLSIPHGILETTLFSAELVSLFGLWFLLFYGLFGDGELRGLLREKRLLLVAGAFLLSLWVSALPAEYRSVAVWNALRLSGFILFFILLYVFLVQQDLGEFAVRVMVLLGLSACLFGFAQLFHLGWAEAVPYWNNPNWPDAVQSFFMHKNVFGNYLVILIWLTLGVRQQSASLAWRRLYTVSLPVFAVTLALTLSRSAWVAFAVPALLSLWFIRKDRAKLRRGIVLLLLFIAAVLANPFAWHRVQSTAVNASLGQVDSESAARFKLWGAALAMVEAHPVLGVGPGNFNYLFPRYSDMRPNLMHHAHSVYMNVLAEQGLFGLFVLLGFLCLFMRNAWQIYVQNENYFFVLGFSSFLISSLFDFLFYNTTFILVLGLLACLSCMSYPSQSTMRNEWQGQAL